MMSARATFLGAVCGTVLTAGGFALMLPSVSDAQEAPATSEWQLPAAPTHPPQTKAQDEAGMEHGRELPAREVLQPTLDPRLAAFAPRHGRDFSGTLGLMCSDVLPGLVRSWMASFTKIYPNVHFDFEPPFEGTDAEQAMRDGGVDIALVSRELKPTDVSSFHGKYGYDPISGLALIDAPVKVIAVGSGDDAVSPTYTDVALAKYPLRRLVYANLNRRPGTALPQVAQEFLRFILSRDGQRDVRREGIYLPLREFQVRNAQRFGGLADRGAGR